MFRLLSSLLVLIATFLVVNSQEDANNGTKLRMCPCSEVKYCLAKSNTDTIIHECMDSCGDNLEEYGDRTHSYLSCFKQNMETVKEAEKCLFETYSYTTLDCPRNGFFGYWRRSDSVIAQPDWKALTNIQYSASTASKTFSNMAWRYNERKYEYMQGFLQCTKNCMLENFQRCTERKECVPKLPTPVAFASLTNECTKKNPKITQALFRTCQCLAWTNGVRDLQGACTVIGNQYYIDRA